jgi:hypothetical protein
MKGEFFNHGAHAAKPIPWDGVHGEKQEPKRFYVFAVCAVHAVVKKGLPA